MTNLELKNFQSMVISAVRGRPGFSWFDGGGDLAADKAISQELCRDLHAWNAEFLDASIDPGSQCAILNWEGFHAKGMELARRLKIEVVAASHVFYVRPIEDPNVFLQVRCELFEDGSIVETPLGLPSELIHIPWLPQQLISGGQTGADRAALDFACFNRIPHGGWCPQGRLAVDGPLSFKYQLRETESAGYRQRTKKNIQDSDATLVFNIGDLDGGTLQTQVLAERMSKPHLLLQLDTQEMGVMVLELVRWLNQGRFSVVNIAGPREEKRPGIYQQVMQLLEASLKVDGTSIAAFADAKVPDQCRSP